MLGLAAALLLLCAAARAEEPGKAYFNAAGCRACHRVGEYGGNAGPDLTFAGFRHSRAWLDLWLADPHGWKKDTLMPNLALSQANRRAIVDYLASLQGQDAQGAAWRTLPEGELGRAVYDRAGCVACHGVRGQGGHPNNNVVGQAVPALSAASRGYTLAELKSKIAHGVAQSDKVDPAGPAPMIAMPAWGKALRPEEIDAVAKYVMTFEGGAATADW